MDPRSPVSVIIPAWNAEECIADVVHAARGQEGLDRPVEVIVVDDGSTDATAEIADRAGAKVIRQENNGPAAARNRGWREASGDTVLFTDSDCFAAPDWASRLLRHLGEEGTGAAGGSYTAANGESLLASCIQEEIALRHSRMRGEVKFLGSFNLAVRRSVLEETGGFDRSFRRASGEDNDLSYRIRKLGHRLIFDPTATVAHRHPTSPARYLIEQARHGYWRMKLYREHPERIAGDDYSGLLDFIEPPLALLSLLIAPFTAHPAGRFLFAGALLLLAATAALPAAAIACRRGEVRLLFFFPVRFFRSYARGFGMASGIARFWFSGRLEGEKG